MATRTGGPKPIVGRGLPSVAGQATVSQEPPEGLEGLAGELWREVVKANPDLSAARTVSLALLCSQMAELSRLRSDSNSVDDMNMANAGLKALAGSFGGYEVDPETRANVAEQRRILVAIRDTGIKRQAAEQSLVLSITRLEEELGLASVKLEDEAKVNLAVIIEQGSYRSGR